MRALILVLVVLQAGCCCAPADAPVAETGIFYDEDLEGSWAGGRIENLFDDERP